MSRLPSIYLIFMVLLLSGCSPLAVHTRWSYCESYVCRVDDDVKYHMKERCMEFGHVIPYDMNIPLC
jgi:uncharacterized protein YceK